MKNNDYKKTVNGKYVTDFIGKRAFVKTSNRKARRANKNICKAYIG